MKKAMLAGTCFLVLCACQIREEIRFNEDGSGTYGMGIDMSEMMGMGSGMDSLFQKSVVDTTVIFAHYLEEKKDSIASLPLAEQKKLEALRPLEFRMKMNEAEKLLDMRLTYVFEKFSDVHRFAEVVEHADIKELDFGIDPMTGMKSPIGSAEDTASGSGMKRLLELADRYETKFVATGFSRKITDQGRSEMLKSKDTAISEDDPFVDLIRFKQVYHFPFRVRSVNNPNARILSDFKGVEIEANMYEMNKEPEFFDIEVAFEK